MSVSGSCQSRTVVFSLPPGAHASPHDFSDQLEKYEGQFVAFGSVGVSHEWHLTCCSSETVTAIVEEGDFLIKGNVPVKVSKLSDISQVGILHWLPFWVDNGLVEAALADYLPSVQFRVTHKYIPGGRFAGTGVYSTQRRVVGSGDISKLPYFLDIVSEGKAHRAHLFVPGRQQICFSCRKIGHMKGQCSQAILVDKVPEVQEKEESSSSSGEESLGEEEEQVQVVKGRSYKILYEKDDVIAPLRSDGHDMIVCPPPHSTICLQDYQAALKKCSHGMCHLIRYWRQEHVSYARLNMHLDEYHQGRFKIVRD